MRYSAFMNYLRGRGCQETFVRLCLDRVQKIEHAFGKYIDDLVSDDAATCQTLMELEYRIEKDDLDNYQNAVKHYYKMVHGRECPVRVPGNRRLK